MGELDPAILNGLRAINNVGPDSIEHTHHLPSIPRQITPYETINGDRPEAGESAQKPSKSDKLSALFRTAVRGGRREDYGSTST